MRFYFIKNEKDRLNLVQLIQLQPNDLIYIFRNYKFKEIRFIYEGFDLIIYQIKNH